METEMHQVNQPADEGNLDMHRASDARESTSQNPCPSQFNEKLNEDSLQCQPLTDRVEDDDKAMPAVTKDCLSLMTGIRDDESGPLEQTKKHQLEADEMHQLDANLHAIKKRKTEGSSSPPTKHIEGDKEISETSGAMMNVETEGVDVPALDAAYPSELACSEVQQPSKILQSLDQSESHLPEPSREDDHSNSENSLNEDHSNVPSSPKESSTEAASAQQVPDTQSEESSPLSSLAEPISSDPSSPLLCKPLGSPFQDQREKPTVSQSSPLESSPVYHQSVSSEASPDHHATSTSPRPSVARQISPKADKYVDFPGLVPVPPIPNRRSSNPPPPGHSPIELPVAPKTMLNMSSHNKDSSTTLESFAGRPDQVLVTTPAEVHFIPNGKSQPLKQTRAHFQCTEQSSPKPKPVSSQRQDSASIPDALEKAIKPSQSSARTKPSFPNPRSAIKAFVPQPRLSKSTKTVVNLVEDDTTEEVTESEQEALKIKRPRIKSNKAQVIVAQTTIAKEDEDIKIKADTTAASHSRSADIKAGNVKRGRPRKVQQAVAECVTERTPAVVLKSIETHAERFPHYERGAVQIQLCISSRQYLYRFHTTVLRLASPWFNNAFKENVAEENEVLAARLREEKRLLLRFELDFAADEKLGSLRRAPFTRPPVVVKLAGKQKVAFYRGSRAEVRQAATIAQEDNDMNYTTQQQEVLEAYNNMFLTYYNLTPNINQHDMQQTIRQTVLLLEIAEVYGSSRIVRPHLNSMLAQFGRDLYRDILHSPLHWLEISIQLESPLLFREAMVHIVGNHQHWPKDQINHPKFPSNLRVLITRKISDLEALKVEIDKTLFASGICIGGKELVLDKCDPTSFNTWIVASCWSSWYSQSMAKARFNQNSCADMVMYRQMAKGGDAYLHPVAIVASVKKIREQYFTPTDEPGIEEDLTIMKTFAQKTVQPLCINHSMLSIEEEDIKYFTCTKIEDSELPWLNKKNS